MPGRRLLSRMLIRPPLGVGNLIGKRGGHENLRQQWIWIEGPLAIPAGPVPAVDSTAWLRFGKGHGRKSREGES